MNKSDIFPMIATKHHIRNAEAEEIVNTVFKEISNALAQGNRIELRGFGIFSTRKHKAKIAHNPKTGEEVSVEQKIVPCFKSSKWLRATLFQKTNK